MRNASDRVSTRASPAAVNRGAAVAACAVLAACAPLSPYTTGTPPLALMPAPQAGVKDARARFREIYCAVLEAHAKDLPDYRPCEEALSRIGDEPAGAGETVDLGPSRRGLIAGIVPGLGWECFADWLNASGGAKTHLQRFGYDARLFDVSGLSGTEVNAQQIRDMILEMQLDPGDPRLVLIGYSKGAPDLLEAVVRYPEIRPYVAAVVSAAGAVGGSPLANPAKQSQADLLRHWPGAKCESGDGKAVESLRPGVRLAWLASNPLPQDFPYYSVVTFPDPDRISSVLRSSYRKLSKVDARNDSQLIFYDEVIPASTLVAYVNADHWALAVPVNRSHPVIGSLFTTQNAYPREALLEALLRFIEEDLSAQGQQAERPAESHSAFAAASGVTRAGGGADDRLPRIVPLTPMSGDVEILYGDPEKPGEPFAMRIRELPGTRIPLHSHPVDEHITVLEGTFYFSVGEDHDDAAATKLTAGGYAFAPAGSSMHGYSPDGAVVQVHGVGPFEIAWRGGLQTLDDPDAKDTFRYRKNASVLTSRGAGVIRQGYASGSIVQYEIDGADGVRYMADEADLRPRPD